MLGHSTCRAPRSGGGGKSRAWLGCRFAEGWNMDFGEMLRVLRRRWIVATVGIVLTLIATVGAYKGWPNKYQSSAEITLIGSKSMANQAGNGGNPYVAVGNLDPVASILAGNVSSDQAVQQ